MSKKDKAPPPPIPIDLGWELETERIVRRPPADSLLRQARRIWAVRGIIAVLVCATAAGAWRLFTTLDQYQTTDAAKAHEAMPEHVPGATQHAITNQRVEALENSYEDIKEDLKYIRGRLDDMQDFVREERRERHRRGN